MQHSDLIQTIDTALRKRKKFFLPPHNKAFRLINGFTEDLNEIVIDIYGKTLVYHDYEKEDSEEIREKRNFIVDTLQEKLPWLTTGLLKRRRSEALRERNGQLIFGKKIDDKIVESGTNYAINLTMNRDASFYLDTRELREWIKSKFKGKTVLNTFSYTGSLGIAALAGGAKEVIHLDLNRNFLNIAARSAQLNGKDINKSHYQTGDFFSRINQFKKQGQSFDCVILDPPVFSKTNKGTIDIANNYESIINKVRPIINNYGYLIVINNALFQTGMEHKSRLDSLCDGEYLKLQELIPVPFDCIGDAEALNNSLPSNPAPYNHSTKISVLRVKKKSESTTEKS